jgi:hypothetical protein
MLRKSGMEESLFRVKTENHFPFGSVNELATTDI